MWSEAVGHGPTNAAVDWPQNAERSLSAEAVSGASRSAGGVLATAGQLLVMVGVHSQPSLGRESGLVPVLHQGREMVEWGPSERLPAIATLRPSGSGRLRRVIRLSR